MLEAAGMEGGGAGLGIRIISQFSKDHRIVSDLLIKKR